MNRISFRRILLHFGWLPILFALVAMGIQAFRITSRPTEFFAVGKVLVVANSPNPVKQPGGPVLTTQQSPEIYGTQIEILESGELRRRALERVRSMNPELREIDVEIRVNRTKGSSILNVAAVGEDGKYTRIFLSALLDEYVALRREMIEKSLGASMNKVIEEVLAREKQVKKKSEDLNRALEGTNLQLLEAEQKRLVAKVSDLRGDAEKLELSSAGRESKDPQVFKQMLEAVRQQLDDAEKKLKQTTDDLQKVQTLKEDFDRAKQDYQDWKKTLDRLDATHVTSADPVAIMERPVVAVETEPDLVQALVIAGCLGGAIGFVIMMVCGLIMEKRHFGREPPALP